MNYFLRRIVNRICDQLGIATKSFLTTFNTSYSAETSKATEYSEQEALDSFAIEVWVYTCVDLIATTIAMLPLRIYKKIKKKIRRVENGEINLLITIKF